METAELVRRYLIEELHLGELSQDLTDDYPILERGLLDSSSLLELVIRIEEACSVEIDEEDLVPDHFGSIGQITSLVASKRSG